MSRKYQTVQNPDNKGNVMRRIDLNLISAVKNGDLDVVKGLVDSGADVTASNNYAVKLAAMGNHLPIVRYLVESGADINDDDNDKWDYPDWPVGSTAVAWAAAHGYLEIVRYLVESGADITMDNNCAIKEAVTNGHMLVVKFLILSGADYKKIGLPKTLGVKKLPRSVDQIISAIDVAIINNE